MPPDGQSEHMPTACDPIATARGTSRQLHTSTATCRCPRAAQHMVAHTVSAALPIRLPLLQPQLLQMVRPATPTTPEMGTTDCQQGQLLSKDYCKDRLLPVLQAAAQVPSQWVARSCFSCDACCRHSSGRQCCCWWLLTVGVSRSRPVSQRVTDLRLRWRPVKPAWGTACGARCAPCSASKPAATATWLHTPPAGKSRRCQSGG